MPDQPLPDDVIQEATRLTRLARQATTDDTDRTQEATHYRNRRETLLAEHGYTARVREDSDPIVILYPRNWTVDGTVQRTAIEDTDNAIERPLTGGASADYEMAATHNDRVVAAVADNYDECHHANAEAFAAFMNNHRARKIETATVADIQEFLDTFYPRNTWATPEQRRIICRSLRYTLETATDQ